jgi:hypothetical protein
MSSHHFTYFSILYYLYRPSAEGLFCPSSAQFSKLHVFPREGATKEINLNLHVNVAWILNFTTHRSSGCNFFLLLLWPSGLVLSHGLSFAGVSKQLSFCEVKTWDRRQISNLEGQRNCLNLKNIVVITQTTCDVIKLPWILPTQCFYSFRSDLRIKNNFSLNRNNRLTCIMDMEHFLFEMLPEL